MGEGEIMKKRCGWVSKRANESHRGTGEGRLSKGSETA
jgi:hypothetical protein